MPTCPTPASPATPPPHGRALSAGSATVFVNGKAAGRKGDAIGCGGNAQTASGNVFIGDKGGSGGGGSAEQTKACQKAQGAGGTPFVSG